MGLFDFLKSKPDVLSVSKGSESFGLKNESSVENQSFNPEPLVEENSDDTELSTPEIPEHIFVEYELPKLKGNMEPIENKPEAYDIHKLLQFLEQNLEKKGYEDALINPDTSYMEEHVKFIHNELNLILARVKIYYTGRLHDINFHIETRKRNGMIETVEELLSHKSTIEDEMNRTLDIEQEATQQAGLCQNLFLSYRKGFKNGFAAITYNTILGKR